MKSKRKKIGVVVKQQHPEALKFAKAIADFLFSRNVQIFFSEENKSITNICPFVQIKKKEKLADLCDLIIVLGGDGTFLSIARTMRNKNPPILGVNMGQLGFLTEIKKEEAFQVLVAIIENKNAPIHKRPLLEITLKRKEKIIFKGPVVNDAVISKGVIARIISMDVWVNHQWVNRIRSDGLIISTTTGSTAYSLASGGPILEPSVEAVVISPICAHSLTLRPLVIPSSAEIKVSLNDRTGRVFLTLDGQEAFEMKKNDIVIANPFKRHHLRVISSSSHDYFSLLREKLKFGARD